jgi:defect-in-organelle-trafficking protein DotD
MPRTIPLFRPGCGPLAGALVVATLLAGCASAPDTAPDATPVALELQRAALDAKAALWQLAAIRQAATGTGLAENGGAWTTPAGLEEPVSVAWIGPYHELVSTVAGRTGYGYEPVGRAPVNPIVVRVNAEQIPAIIVLRDASWQVRDRAALEIDDPRRTLRVRFHHVD